MLPDQVDIFPVLDDPTTPTQIEKAGYRSRSQLDRDIASGRLRAYKLGGRIFIRKSDFLAMVQPVRGAK